VTFAGFVSPRWTCRSAALLLILSGCPECRGLSNVRQLSPSRLSPDWAGAAGMIGVSVLLAGLGIAGFARRDLRG
jgi:hypothetical protein